MMRAAKLTLIIVGSCAVLVAMLTGLWLLWSWNYALAFFAVFKRWDAWSAFVGKHDLTLPVEQAAANWGHPLIHKAVTIASTASAIEVALAAGAGYAVVVQPWKIKPPNDGARMGTLADIKKAGLLDGQPGMSILLGTFAGKDVRYSGDSHFFVNGPSRSGKGRGFVMTNLLEWRGSVIVLDVKMENWFKTGPTRARMGQELFLFAPGSPESHCWNPLDFIRPWPARATDLGTLAATLLPTPEGADAYWIETARSLFAGMVGYVMDSQMMAGRRTLRSVLRMFSVGEPGEPGEALFGVLKTILQNEPTLPSFIADAFRQHLGREIKQRGSFEAHITTALAAWNNRLLADVTSHSDFDITQLRKRPFSIFIAAPVSDFGVVEPLIRLLIQQIHDVLLRKEPGEDEPHKVLFMLDEFYQFKRLPEIVYRAPLVAGFGFRIAIIAQNFPQIDERYGKTTREALLGNMDVKLFVAVGDDVTADSVSRDFGKHYVERSGWNTGNRPGFGNRSVSSRYESVPLMPADMTKRLDDKKAMLLVRGHYGVVLDKLNFYTEKRFREVVAASEAFKRMLVVPVVPLAREWPLFKPKPASGDPDSAWSDHRPESDLSPTASLTGASGSEGAGADQDGASEDAFAEISADRSRIARNAALAYEDGWRLRTVVDEAMRAEADDQTATIAFNLRTNPEIYGVLRGSRGLFGWDRHRRKALSAVAEVRRDVLAMRHAIRERKTRSALQRRGAAAQLIAAGNAVLASMGDAPATDGDADRPSVAASEGPDHHRAAIQMDQQESSIVVEIVASAEMTLASAAKAADSMAKKAALTRIGEAFAKARASLSDEDRRENTLSGPGRAKRPRARNRNRSLPPVHGLQPEERL
ncbi:type IV secretory system conjugative DNA transfer family protein [Methylocapsa sp. S129]|uniref:type IV secretory system conjugative DNA transfer family protein n=1 Tax=Methylocapsa sp. S129 TaxID=1641869 RepID=UPI00131D74B1|nr:type IV secretory system conjugative DNA transfer family protein [Methylocapsa sp. S129]